MPLPIVGGILAFLSGWFARFVGASLLRFVALKVVLVTLCTTILPIVLYNVISFISSEMMDLVQYLTQGSSIQPFILQLTGFAGWLGGCLKLPLAFTAVMSGAILKFVMCLIPFIGEK